MFAIRDSLKETPYRYSRTFSMESCYYFFYQIMIDKFEKRKTLGDLRYLLGTKVTLKETYLKNSLVRYLNALMYFICMSQFKFSINQLKPT